MGVPAEKVNEDRWYRALDRLRPHKGEWERHLEARLGELFPLDDDLRLYDVTSTDFEGEAANNPPAQRGYSRDPRPDCKQLNLARGVTRGSLPLGYEVFTGNRNDVTTGEEMVEKVEALYGRASRIGVLDRGMVSEANLEFLQRGSRRYSVGPPKSGLRRFERELLAQDGQRGQEGLEVKRCPGPADQEVFILCRSAQRPKKEQARPERFERRSEAGWGRRAAAGQKRKPSPVELAQRVGRLLGQNPRAAGLFPVEVGESASGVAELRWSKSARWQDWAQRSAGGSLLRSHVTEWSAEELGRADTQLPAAEAALRIQKSDLELRPVWHQKESRVHARIRVCFLASVLWKTLGQLCRRRGWATSPARGLKSCRSSNKWKWCGRPAPESTSANVA